MLFRYGLGADAKALTVLTAALCVLTALLEAGVLWGRRGYELSWTLSNNFSLAALDVGVPPAWQVLAFGLVFALGAFGREAFRVRALALRRAKSGREAYAYGIARPRTASTSIFASDAPQERPGWSQSLVAQNASETKPGAF